MSTLTEPWMKTILLINPVTMPMEMIRYAMLGKGMIHWGYYGLSWVFTAVVAFLGVMIFNKVERTFMDTV